VNVVTGSLTRLRVATEADVSELVRIRQTPEVQLRWRGSDVAADIRASIADNELQFLTIEDPAGHIVGAIQWAANDDPDYPHVGIDVFVDPQVHGRGFGSDAIRTLCRHLVSDEHVHRFVIDPAADNTPAIRCYEKVGFRAVGVMRRYERGVDGSLHDGLLMDMLADEIIGDVLPR
jgi:aminoglycoside 6'-N-acetyltransferase